VLIVLIDDMGFGQSSAFGGPIHMPTAEKLASEGLRCNEFQHDRVVLADARGTADGTQSSREQSWLNHGDHHCLPGANRPAAEQRSSIGRDVSTQ